jgi:hypothetical protein
MVAEREAAAALNFAVCATAEREVADKFTGKFADGLADEFEWFTANVA